MSDDKLKRGTYDRDRININEDYELAQWSKKLGVSPTQFRAAVEKVGDRVKDVEAELNGGSK